MKKPLIYLLILLPLLLLLTACGDAPTVTVYRALAPAYRSSGELVREEAVAVTPDAEVIQSLIEAFNTIPASQELINPMGSGGAVLAYSLEGRALRLQVNEDWARLSDGDLTLARCCAVLTFCALEQVDTVSVYFGTVELCPPLSAEAFILSDISA